MARLSFYPLFLTLVVVYISLAAVPSAQALQGMNLAPPQVFRRAEHIDLSQRMIKKKRAEEVPGNAAPNPTSTSSSTSASSPVDPVTPPAGSPTPSLTPSVSIPLA